MSGGTISVLQEVKCYKHVTISDYKIILSTIGVEGQLVGVSLQFCDENGLSM